MNWMVQSYIDQTGRVPVDVVQQEAVHLLGMASHALDCASLMGWLSEVVKGHAVPTSEPKTSAKGQNLRYRCHGNAVVILSLVDHQLLLALAFGNAASSLPTVHDLNMAADRLVEWRRLNVGAKPE